MLSKVLGSKYVSIAKSCRLNNHREARRLNLNRLLPTGQRFKGLKKKFCVSGDLCCFFLGLIHRKCYRIPTLAVWGTAGGVALVHFTDWRIILDYVPYVSGKFKKDE